MGNLEIIEKQEHW